MLGICSSSGLTLAGMASMLITTPLLLSHLNAEAYGINIVVQQVIAYAGQMDFGFGAALLRRFGQAQAEEESAPVTNRLLNNGILFFGVMALVLLIAGLPSVRLISSWMEVSGDLSPVMEDLLRTSLILLAVQLLFKPFYILLFARHRQVAGNLILQGSGLALPWLIAAFVVSGHGLYSFIYANTITSIASWVATAVVVRREFQFLKLSVRFWDKSILRDLFGYGKLIFVISLCDLVVVNSERLITGAALSIGMVTMLSLSIRIPELVVRMSYQFLAGVNPHLIEYTHIERDMRKLRQRYFEVLQVFMLIVAGLLAGLAVTVGDFVKLWVGPEYFIGNWLLLAFLGTKLLLAVHQVNGVVLSALGELKWWTRISCIHAVVHLVLVIWMAKQVGIAGVVLGPLIAQALTASLVNTVTVCRSVGCRVWELHWRAIAPSLGMFALGGCIVGGLKAALIGTVDTWGAFFELAGIASCVLGGCGLLLIRSSEFQAVDRYTSRLGALGKVLEFLRTGRQGSVGMG